MKKTRRILAILGLVGMAVLEWSDFAAPNDAQSSYDNLARPAVRQQYHNRRLKPMTALTMYFDGVTRA